MLVKDIFLNSIKIGIQADPRGVAGVKKHLARIKKEYDNLKPKDKESFDMSRMENPYPDAGIHNDDEKTQVKRVLVGIDIGSSEILLASQLGERGKKIDMVIAHHPIGKSLANLHEVMDMSIDIYEKLGVPVHVAEKIFEERLNEVGRGVHASNHFQSVDMAKLLNINFVNIHTPTDNLVNQFLTEYFKKTKPETVDDVIDLLLEIPEYSQAKKMGTGPKLISGSARHRAGRLMVDMTGGTGPSDTVYKELSRHGISTIVGMHMGEASLKKAREHYINVVIAGHMASDSLGVNLLLDELEKKGIEVVPCGGLIRVSRLKKK